MKPWGIQRPMGRSSEQKVSLTSIAAVFSQMAFSRKDGFGQGEENKRKSPEIVRFQDFSWSC